MQKVWKIGTRWGKGGPSNLDLFLNYQCAFFGLDAKIIGNWKEAQVGDLLLTCDRSKPVAIGIMTSKFDYYYNQSEVKFCKKDEESWIERPDIVICKARFILLSEYDRNHIEWGNDAYKRFCRQWKNNQMIIDKLDEYLTKEKQGVFEIQSRTVNLISDNKNSGVFSPRVRYRIPVYQRPYSWGEQEIRRLIEELFEAANQSEPAFMGTMQLSAPIPLGNAGGSHDWAYDIIDGQQRTTTLMLLQCVLEDKLGKCTKDNRDSNYITHVNRGAAQNDLDAFWEIWSDQDEHLSAIQDTDAINPYLANVAVINNLLAQYIDEYATAQETGSNVDKLQFYNRLYEYIYIQNSLRFVVIETHAGLSKTLKIFNTINTAGLDLGVEDIFKLRMYEYQKDVNHQPDKIFDEISRIYEQIETRKTICNPGLSYSMTTVLEIYQRILIAKYKLPNELDTYETDRFFERLFDTLLNVKTWKEFKDRGIILSIDDLERIVQCMDVFSEEYRRSEDLKIMRSFLELTGYYRRCWNYPIIALFFKSISPDEMIRYNTVLFKLLVPSSLYWSKIVSSVKRSLLGILKDMPYQNLSGLASLNDKLEPGLDNGSPRDELNDACTNNLMALNRKWKNLSCRMYEYLLMRNNNKLSHYNLFQCSVDIEHIKSYTDKEDPNKVWDTWGNEINFLGNLVLLESGLNRSVGNNNQDKPNYYRSSVFLSANELHDKVANWEKTDAEERRKKLTKCFAEYLFTPC